MLKPLIHALPIWGLLALTAAPPAMADTDYGPLRRVGVTAGSAKITGRQLTVAIRVGRSVRVTIAALTGDRRITFAKATLRKGRYRFSGRLRGRPAGSVRIRITAVDVRTKRRGRGTRRARPARQAPTRLDVASLSIPENVPGGAVVGELAAVDPTARDTHAFALVGGDDGAFRLDGSTLRTTRSLDFEGRSRYELRVRVTDRAGGAAERTLPVQVVDVDDAPVVAVAAAPLRWTEGEPPTLVDPLITVADQDDASLDGASIRLAGPVAAGDELAFNGSGGVSGAYDPATGRLDLSGTASLAAYQAVLRSVTYRHAGDAPPASRLVEVSVRSRGATSATVTRAIEVAAVNDAPTIAVADGAVAISPGDDPFVDPFLTVSDPDGVLSGATVSIGGEPQPGDRLEVPPGAPLGASYDPGAMVLTFSGAAPAAEYQDVLRRVRFVASSAGGNAERRIEFVVADPGGASATDSRMFSASP